MGLVSNIINDEKGTFYSDEKGTKKNDVDIHTLSPIVYLNYYEIGGERWLAWKTG